MWSDELAQIAQDHAERCQFMFNNDREDLLSNFPSVGENIFVGFGDTDYQSHISTWTRESSDFNAVTGACRSSCSQYTQVQSAWMNFR